MESLRCFVEGCETYPLKFCNCKFPAALFCNDHVTLHNSEKNYHMVEDIPKNHSLDIKQNTICLNDELYINQKYFIAAGTDLMNYYKIETCNIDLPKDYKSTFNSMVSVFITEIFKIPKGKTKKIQKRCSSFVNAITYVIKNITISLERLVSAISISFDEMYSKIETEINNHLNGLINNLLADKIMKAKTGVIFTESVEDTKKKFFFEIMTEALSCEEILSKFYETFRQFLPPQEFLIKYVEVFQKKFTDV